MLGCMFGHSWGYPKQDVRRCVKCGCTQRYFPAYTPRTVGGNTFTKEGWDDVGHTNESFYKNGDLKLEVSSGG